eukprot:11796764-Alexandrium_andersonii.AAC.1
MAESDACWHCGASPGTFMHLFWECPAFEAIREPVLRKWRAEGLEPQQAPAALTVHGIAPAVLAIPGAPLWAGCGAQFTGPHAQLVEQLMPGIQPDECTVYA